LAQQHQKHGMRRPVQHIHEGIYEPIADLKTWRAMPTHSLRELDPFLFLNHHGPQDYGPNNQGLPFGPHPHRGFETLTFVLQGDITHKDSVSGESVIRAGGIQWMTAGKGLIHAEVSSDQFKREGGREEVLQLWMNLPAKYKMVDPQYTGLEASQIPTLQLAEDKVNLHLISGEIAGQRGPINSLTGLFTSWLDLQADAQFTLDVPQEAEILFYVVHGQVQINGEQAATHQLVQFGDTGSELAIRTEQDSQLLFCYGKPFQEPIVAHGPFVMNTREEIEQAFRDYQSGNLGSTAL